MSGPSGRREWAYRGKESGSAFGTIEADPRGPAVERTPEWTHSAFDLPRRTASRRFAIRLEEPEPQLLEDEATGAASASFGELSRSLAVSEIPGLTLEDMVQKMLRPLLKEWLNENLPPMVERLVQEEIERVSKHGGAR